ncbi:hypothetical protein [Ancylobacter koreensis]|uniref:hypothetical protein n=1 Tax=Ancylobacter koreensis TaxID=266121 RepID=UPI0031BB4B09
MHLGHLDRAQESSGEFIWQKGTVCDILAYRPPDGEAARRSIADIPLAELGAVVLDNMNLLHRPDPARELAGLIGVERLVAVSRARLEEAIARVRPPAADRGPG